MSSHLLGRQPTSRDFPRQRKGVGWELFPLSQVVEQWDWRCAKLIPLSHTLIQPHCCALPHATSTPLQGPAIGAAGLASPGCKETR